MEKSRAVKELQEAFDGPYWKTLSPRRRQRSLAYSPSSISTKKTSRGKDQSDLQNTPTQLEQENAIPNEDSKSINSQEWVGLKHKESNMEEIISDQQQLEIIIDQSTKDQLPSSFSASSTPFHQTPKDFIIELDQVLKLEGSVSVDLNKESCPENKFKIDPSTEPLLISSNIETPLSPSTLNISSPLDSFHIQIDDHSPINEFSSLLDPLAVGQNFPKRLKRPIINATPFDPKSSNYSEHHYPTRSKIKENVIEYKLVESMLPCNQESLDDFIVGDTNLVSTDQIAPQLGDEDCPDYPISDNWHLPSHRKSKEAQNSTLERLRKDKKLLNKRNLIASTSISTLEKTCPIQEEMLNLNPRQHSNPSSMSMDSLGKGGTTEVKREVIERGDLVESIRHSTGNSIGKSISIPISTTIHQGRSLSSPSRCDYHTLNNHLNPPPTSTPSRNRSDPFCQDNDISVISSTDPDHDQEDDPNPLEVPNLPSFRADFIVDDGFGYTDPKYKWKGYDDPQRKKKNTINHDSWRPPSPIFQLPTIHSSTRNKTTRIKSSNSLASFFPKSTFDSSPPPRLSVYHQDDDLDFEMMESMENQVMSNLTSPLVEEGPDSQSKSSTASFNGNMMTRRVPVATLTPSNLSPLAPPVPSSANTNIRIRVSAGEQHILVSSPSNENVQWLIERIQTLYEQVTNIQTQVEKLETVDGFSLLAIDRIQDVIRDNDLIKAKLKNCRPRDAKTLYTDWCQENNIGPSLCVLDQISITFPTFEMSDRELRPQSLQQEGCEGGSRQLNLESCHLNDCLSLLSILRLYPLDSINLSHNALEYNEIIPVLDALNSQNLSSSSLSNQTSSNMVRINLSHNQIQGLGISNSRFFPLLIDLKGLKELDLSSNPLTDLSADGLASLIQKSPNLISITLNHVLLTQEALKHWKNLHIQLGKLNKLAMSHNLLTQQGVEMLIDMILQDGGDQSKIESLELAHTCLFSRTDMEPTTSPILRLAQTHTLSIKYLDISGNYLSETPFSTKTLYHIGQMAHRLKHLNLSYCSITPTMSQGLFLGLENNKILQHLVLSGNPLGPLGSHLLSLILPTCSALETLELKSCRLSIQGVLNVIKSCGDNCSRILHLDLSDNQMATMTLPTSSDDLIQHIQGNFSKQPQFSTILQQLESTSSERLMATRLENIQAGTFNRTGIGTGNDDNNNNGENPQWWWHELLVMIQDCKGLSSLWLSWNGIGKTLGQRICQSWKQSISSTPSGENRACEWDHDARPHHLKLQKQGR